MLVLVFCLTFGSTYAYFTATAKKQYSNLSTAIVRVDFSSETAGQIVSDTIVVTNRAVEPGDRVGFGGAVVNIGNEPIYAMLIFEVVVSGDTLDTIYDTADGKTELVAESDGKYTASTTLIPPTSNNTVNFSVNYLLDGNIYDNTYQGQSVSVNLTVLAIQQANVQANQAINLMLGIE